LVKNPLSSACGNRNDLGAALLVDVQDGLGQQHTAGRTTVRKQIQWRPPGRFRLELRFLTVYRGKTVENAEKT
jgi:hypothetical protein